MEKLKNNKRCIRYTNWANKYEREKKKWKIALSEAP